MGIIKVSNLSPPLFSRLLIVSLVILICYYLDIIVTDPFVPLTRFLVCLPAALSLALPCTTCLLHVHYMTITCQLHNTARGKSSFPFITRSTSIPSSSSIQQHPYLPLQFSLQQSVFFGLCNGWTMLSDKDKNGFFHFHQTGVSVGVGVRWGY